MLLRDRLRFPLFTLFTISGLVWLTYLAPRGGMVDHRYVAPAHESWIRPARMARVELPIRLTQDSYESGTSDPVFQPDRKVTIP